jgi:hypothetical protein
MTTATKVTKVAAMGRRDQNVTDLAQLVKMARRRQYVIGKDTDWWLNTVHGI